MGLIARLRLSFWITVIGTVSLYVFFVSLATIPPEQIAGVTAMVATLAAIVTVRNMRVARQLADRGGDPHLRRSRNQTRERRGF
jgi:hypothetical protein